MSSRRSAVPDDRRRAQRRRVREVPLGPLAAHRPRQQPADRRAGTWRLSARTSRTRRSTDWQPACRSGPADRRDPVLSRTFQQRQPGVRRRADRGARRARTECAGGVHLEPARPAGWRRSPESPADCRRPCRRDHFDAVVRARSIGRATSGVPVLERLGVPIIQAITSGMPREAWEVSRRGLTALDTAINVAIPEFDGRIISVPMSFKDRADDAAGTVRAASGSDRPHRRTWHARWLASVICRAPTCAWPSS